MITLLATLALAQATMTDFSAVCLEEMQLTAVPTNHTQLFLYRRCVTQKKHESEEQKTFDSNLQRMDQQYWQRKEKADASAKTSAKDISHRIRTNLKRRADAHGDLKARKAKVLDAARSIKRSIRMKEQGEASSASSAASSTSSISSQ